MIDIAVEGGIATVTVPELARLSDHDTALAGALRDAIRAFDDRDDIKVLLLISSGADFCPRKATIGAPFNGGPSRAEWLSVFASASGLYQTWCFSRKVTVAVVQGQCTGAGTILTLLADLSIATTEAKFESPFATLPEASFVVAALTMGLNRAKSWMVSGAVLSAAEAEAAGLVNQVVAAERLDAEARRMARACCKVPIDGIAMSKLMLESYLDGQGLGEEFDHVPFYAAAMADAS